MKKIFGILLLAGVAFGANSSLFAQGGQNPPPQDGKRMGRAGGGIGGMMRGHKRGGKQLFRGHLGLGRFGGGMRGFGISDEEIAKLNLTDAQKVKLFDFRKKMAEERAAMLKNFRDSAAQRPDMSLDEIRQLMNAKSLGTLTPEQKAKLDGLEAKRREMLDKRKAEMEAMKSKMEAKHQEFLNIFTLEQRKQLETIRNERAKEMQEKFKRRQGAPGGPPPPAAPQKPELN